MMCYYHCDTNDTFFPLGHSELTPFEVFFLMCSVYVSVAQSPKGQGSYLSFGVFHESSVTRYAVDTQLMPVEYV